MNNFDAMEIRREGGYAFFSEDRVAVVPPPHKEEEKKEKKEKKTNWPPKTGKQGGPKPANEG